MASPAVRPNEFQAKLDLPLLGIDCETAYTVGVRSRFETRGFNGKHTAISGSTRCIENCRIRGAVRKTKEVDLSSQSSFQVSLRTHKFITDFARTKPDQVRMSDRVRSDHGKAVSRERR